MKKRDIRVSSDELFPRVAICKAPEEPNPVLEKAYTWWWHTKVCNYKLFEMDEDHIRNCIGRIKRETGFRQQWLEPMELELEKRRQARVKAAVGTYVCKSCNMAFNYKSDYQKHVEEVHTEDSPKTITTWLDELAQGERKSKRRDERADFDSFDKKRGKGNSGLTGRALQAALDDGKHVMSHSPFESLRILTT